MDAQRLSQALVEDIYATALEPSRWTETMTRCADRIGADGAQVVTYTRGGAVVRYCVSGRIDPAADEDYIAHYHRLDVRIPRVLSAQPFVIYDDHAFLTAEERRASAFHNEFLKRYDCERVLLVIAPLTPNDQMLFALGRSARNKPFSINQRQRILNFLPHLQRSIRMTLHSAADQDRRRGLEALLNAHDFGMVLCDEHGRIMHSNAVAAEIARRFECIFSFGDSFAVRGADNRARFASGVRKVRKVFHDSGHRSIEAMRLHDPNVKDALELLLLPVQSASGHLLTAIYLIDTTRGSGCVSDVLAGLYRMTPAEARCAERLLDGNSIDGIAESLGLSRNTVRAQLRSIFTKTGVSRQSELIALLTRSVASLAAMFTK